MVRQRADIHQRGGTPIFMATTATPTILATTATILSTPPCLATGTITKLARRGEVMTRSQLVSAAPSECFFLDYSIARATSQCSPRSFASPLVARMRAQKQKATVDPITSAIIIVSHKALLRTQLPIL